MKRIFFNLICILSISPVLAQRIPIYSTYIFNPITINPAYTGYSPKVDFVTEAAGVMPQVEGAPKSGYMSLSAPMLHDHMGVGGMVQYDKIGVSSTFDLGLTYAYKIISENKNSYTSWGYYPVVVSFGLQMGVTMIKEELSTLGVIGDRNFDSDINETLPTFSTGILISRSRFYAGASFSRFFAKELSNEEVGLTSHAFLQLGYILELSPTLYAKPGFLLRYAHGAPFQFEQNIILEHKSGFLFGTGYRSTSSMNFLVGFKISDTFKFVYHYNKLLDGNTSFISDTHGIMLALKLNPIIYKNGF